MIKYPLADVGQGTVVFARTKAVHEALGASVMFAHDVDASSNRGEVTRLFLFEVGVGESAADEEHS